VVERAELRRKILVIDDDAVARRVLEQRLRESGYSTVFAFDAVSVLRIARDESPDLILLDIGLPGGDGFVVMERLKRIQTLAHIPVIVFTAREQAREQALAAGAAAFFEKTRGPDAVLAEIREQLGS